jgi:hypothetical protein
MSSKKRSDRRNEKAAATRKAATALVILGLSKIVHVRRAKKVRCRGDA